MWANLRSFLWKSRWYIVVAGASVFVGLCLAAAYGTVIDYTSTLNFCAHTCHEMESTVYQEYTHSRHFRNKQGVVVVCADCHVPHHEWPATLETKFLASFELWGHFFRREYVVQNFEARRPALEKAVWANFAATNARECKACHRYANMISTEQNPSARALHAIAMKTDANCVECHKGITHQIVTAQEISAPGGAAMEAAHSRIALGQEVYSRNCAACHNNLSPKLGDAAAWKPLIKQGDQTLVAGVIHGKGAMPPRAGNPALSDSDIAAAVRYIESKAE